MQAHIIPKGKKKSLYAISALIFMTVFYFYRKSQIGHFDLEKVKKLQRIKLESAPFCLTKSRLSFDRYLERNSRYDYLEADPYSNSKLDSAGKNFLKESGGGGDAAILRKKYFFAINLYNNEEAIPYMIQELMLLFKFFGVENIFLSLYENGSKDKTKSMLKDFSNYLKTFDIKHDIVLDDRSRPKEFHRIEYLAKIRNYALDPLEKEKKKGRVYDKIIFMNDIFFCRNDILELVYQSDLQVSDFTCPLDFFSESDWDPPLRFRDNWVARDIEGDRFSQILEELSDHPESQLRNEQRLPFQVQCSWNGVAVLNPKPFYDENPLRFRRSNIETGECSASECSLLCNDFWDRGFRRIVVVPEILVSYRHQDAVFLDSNYEELLKINRTLNEKIKYIDGPEQVFCAGLDGMNILEPDQPDLWVNYTTTGAKVV
ncbi:Alpha-1,3-mannosyltransferase CMT1 [Smittium mucronatum]|uniref:Alpha-1,3-mannosyltransferase CMT1 n=1 Tax=Smittium mucronatum TaxID=133383 RepID=A0A1R0H250_9FUNG|nr:Alpha-1,3-mannosyltransferase CMT1 [Smittium mucronatum]